MIFLLMKISRQHWYIIKGKSIKPRHDSVLTHHANVMIVMINSKTCMVSLTVKLPKKRINGVLFFVAFI